MTGIGWVADGLLSRHVARGDLALLDTVDRLTGLAIEDVQIPRLGRDAQRGDRPLRQRGMSNRTGGAGRIRVPEIVVNRLKVPGVVPGLEIDGDHRVAEQIVSRPVSSVGAGNG